MNDDLFVHVWRKADELVTSNRSPLKPILSTMNVKNLTFSTVLPGGFGDGSFTLPSIAYDIDFWQQQIIGGRVVFSTAADEVVYEGLVEGCSVLSEGLQVHCMGYYAKAAVTQFNLAPGSYPTLYTALKNVCDMMTPAWWGAILTPFYIIDTYGQYPVVRSDFTATDYSTLYDAKVSDAINELLKYPAFQNAPAYLMLYENRAPFYGPVFTPLTYSVSIADMNVSYGSSLSLAGVYNIITVVYESLEGVKGSATYTDQTSVDLYGPRVGVMNIGKIVVPAGGGVPPEAQNALDLASTRLPLPSEQADITI